jgi:membrane protein
MNTKSQKISFNPKNLLNFIQRDIWRIRTQKISKRQSFWIKQLRMILLSLRGFGEDKCQLWASALTFYTLLSIVPLMAMAFGIAKGFGFEQMLENQIINNLRGQEEVAGQIMQFARSFLENAKGGVIAGIGVVALFWIVVRVLGNIENAFNDIWGIKKGRPLGRKFSDYLSIMLICPFLLIMSSSVTVLITSQVRLITEKIVLLGALSPVILAILKILPYGVIWILFTFIYIFIPNTKVNFRSAFIGGIIAGTIYQVVQWAYITFQIGVSKYGAIYGSFAALPLFLIWLQVSWLIVLFGAEISFAEQNVDTYEFEPDCLQASPSFKKLLSLYVASVCVKNFVGGEGPLTGVQISDKLDIPIRLTRQILFELTDARILSEFKAADGRSSDYQPARDVSNLTIEDVLEALDQRGTEDIPVNESDEFKKLAHCLSDFRTTLHKLPANKLLKDI